MVQKVPKTRLPKFSPTPKMQLDLPKKLDKKIEKDGFICFISLNQERKKRKAGFTIKARVMLKASALQESHESYPDCNP